LLLRFRRDLSIHTCQGSSSLTFLNELLRSNVTLLHVGATILEVKCSNVTVTVEPLHQAGSDPRLLHEEDIQLTHRIVLNERRKRRIGHHSIEDAIHSFRNFALDCKVPHFSLETTWLHEIIELRPIRISSGMLRFVFGHCADIDFQRGSRLHDPLDWHSPLRLGYQSVWFLLCQECKA